MSEPTQTDNMLEAALTSLNEIVNQPNTDYYSIPFQRGRLLVAALGSGRKVKATDITPWYRTGPNIAKRRT